jgi:hypothetical protein
MDRTDIVNADKTSRLGNVECGVSFGLADQSFLDLSVLKRYLHNLRRDTLVYLMQILKASGSLPAKKILNNKMPSMMPS